MTRTEMEQRRVTGAALLAQGHTQAFVARRMRVSRTTVSRWVIRAERGKLAITKTTGRPRKLGAEKIQELRELLRRNDPMQFQHTRWNARTVRAWMQWKWGVTMHVDHVRKIVQAIQQDLRKGKC